MEDSLKEWREFLRGWFERQEERKLRDERLYVFYLKQEKLFKFLARASRKRAYSVLEEEISVSMDEIHMLYNIGEGVLISPNAPINDNCYLQRVEIHGQVFRTITNYLIPYPPDARVKGEEHVSF